MADRVERRPPGTLKMLVAERLTTLGNRLRSELLGEKPPSLLARDVEVIQMAAQILTYEVEKRK